MNNRKRFPEEFKIEAVKQITERGHRVADVAAQFGFTLHPQDSPESGCVS